MSADFKKIRQDLAKYDLQIESKANRGVYVKGERNKRRFIMDYFFRDNFFQSLHNYINIEVPGRQISLEELTIIVLDECREGHLKLSDFVIQNLVIHIALSFLKKLQKASKLARLKTGNKVIICQNERLLRKFYKCIWQLGWNFPERSRLYHAPFDFKSFLSKARIPK